ncbi:YeeE/YedE thiosulfate transporter family protein [Acinetobacter bereziniae]|nr:YeeE/YedE thiosulfate transporter family protein [Acinetobacter bereziniae]MBJ9907726.1 YeeE/YedE family protein [Acinetobacter bereziniae]MBJ9929091.1 YeeE/YedE family protein [Acinetobacter bereziniae]MDG3556926.1 YeeE/YedE thiosulfate transporter family protein [Acinetobacter bereziniae]MDP6002719.1 YeeE/YedE thiosulfate transporter family protein [Acinetobacter bereziniae]QQC82665.1 YeeE/YedE family protein [Acinetobacter bereziniae]
MHDFILAFIGGTLLGLAVVGYLLVNGRIAGISGLVAQVLNPKTLLKTPALWFLLGLLITPFFYNSMVHPQIEMMTTDPILLIIAGLLVGFGTRLGSGCTSGHGICGISRLSKRSFVATCTFMLTGFMTVYVMRHVLGA